MGKRLSVEFFICSALMLVFGVGLGSSRQPVGLELALAAAVAGAGLLLLTGHEQARIVGIVVLGAVTLVGAVSTFSGSYMPGTIVALITLIRMVSTGGGFSVTGGLPPDPPNTGQPQYYGQVPGYGGAGPSQPYGTYAPPQAVPQQQLPQPTCDVQPLAQPYAGDPRFGAPTAPSAAPAVAPPVVPVPAPQPAPPVWPAPPAGRVR